MGKYYKNINVFWQGGIGAGAVSNTSKTRGIFLVRK